MGNTFYFGWEVAFMEWIQHFMNGALIKFMGGLSFLCEDIVLILLVTFFYFGYNKKIGRKLILSVGLGIVTHSMIKNIFNRRRPYFDHSTIKCLRPVHRKYDSMDIVKQGFSFPSGHATGSIAIYGMFFTLVKNKFVKALLFVVILLIGFSRISLGVHYPTDIIVGWCLGIAIIALVNLLEDKIKSNTIKYSLLIAIGLPGWFYCSTDDFFNGFGLILGVILGILLEEKYINFDNTRNILRIIIRMFFALLLFAFFAMKMDYAFIQDNLNWGEFGNHFFATLKFTIAGFVVFGMYPMAIKFISKIFPSKNNTSTTHS